MKGVLMELNSIPDIFQSKIRLAIISSLLTGSKSFKEVKGLTGATEGNISTHMKKLSTAGIVEISKMFENNKPKTTYTLTDKGIKDFTDYVKQLEAILNQSKRNL